MEMRAAITDELAIEGGTAIWNQDFSPWPEFGQDEVQVVQDVLRSGQVNYWTGPHGRAFEDEFAWNCGVEHGIALVNGSVALELALRALRIGPGDEVIVTPRSYVASAGAIMLVGARAVFADVDADSQNITAATIAPRITSRTKAILAVHLAGLPCEMDAILDLAGAHGLYVVEDCAQAHGARYKGRPVGSFGHAAAFSFCQDKIMSTGGEGGLLVTDDTATWQRAWSYKDHGKDHALAMSDKTDTGFRWLHGSFGTNWRMTEMQAAIGRRQLKKLPLWHQQRTANAALLNEGLGEIAGLRVPTVPGHMRSGWYKYYAFVRPESLRAGWDRNRIMSAIWAEGVPCFSGSCPEIYREKAFRDAGYDQNPDFPVARDLGETSLMFQIHPTLTEVELLVTIEAARKVFRRAAR